MAIGLLNIIRSAYTSKTILWIFCHSIAVWLGFYRSEQRQKSMVVIITSYNHILSTIIGLLWSLFSITVFTVPYLYKCGIDLRRSIGCATLTSIQFSQELLQSYLFSQVYFRLVFRTNILDV